MKDYILSIAVLLLIVSCKEDRSHISHKGFEVNPVSSENGDNDEVKEDGIKKDSLGFETRPRGVLKTSQKAIRLTPIYKVNYNKKTKRTFIGNNAYHSNYYGYEGDRTTNNNWHNNIMPGFEAVYGFNFVNVSHHNNETNERHNFFQQPVLIKTLYYPTFSKDTLNDNPVIRNYYMVSVYDEDTNKDGMINIKDLRRFYVFDTNGVNKRLLIPENYSVMSSEYDVANDKMYVFARFDENNDGRGFKGEPVHIFWINLNNPSEVGRQY